MPAKEKILLIFAAVILMSSVAGCGGGGGGGGLSGNNGENSGSIPNSGSTISLSWDAPATNSDGTPLTDLAGYKIYIGTSTGIYSEIVDAGNVSAYTIENLTPGVYYFVVVAYNTSGNESDFSNEVALTVT
ncbi:MAG: hypothetical protein C4526_03900 [Nitrospiraceae bacterium]|nr:MAG: hypothetical protein C4526_03900 [Nitrospiraceae bacterium]